MIAIDANGIRKEKLEMFCVICGRCGSSETIIKIGGAEEFGEVGNIEVTCNVCGAAEYSTYR